MNPTRTIIHLGSGNQGQERKDKLESIAAELGAISQRGKPSIGRLLVMIADGELGVVGAEYFVAAEQKEQTQ